MLVIPNQISHIAQFSQSSADNSSSANLADAGTFTGEWTRVPVGSRLVLTCKTDQNVTIQVQYSPDGSNQDSTITRYYRTDQIEAPHIFINARPYFRVSVTNNSGSSTTYLRLNSYVMEETGLLNIPVDSTMSQDYDSISVRPTGFTEEVALGRRQGWEVWNKFGYNDDVDTGSEEIIASFGGTFSRMTTADTLSIVSSSANDTDSGTGVNSVVIYGIDENREPVIAVYTMNGITPVVTTGQNWLGVNRVAMYLAGSGNINDGKITVTATTAGSIQAEMPADEGVTQQCIFHVPAAHTFLADMLRFNVNKLAGGSSPKVTIKGYVFSAVNEGLQEIYKETMDTAIDQVFELNPIEPFVVGEKSILYFYAVTDTNNTVVRGRFSGKLARDPDA